MFEGLKRALGIGKKKKTEITEVPNTPALEEPIVQKPATEVGESIDAVAPEMPEEEEEVVIKKEGAMSKLKMLFIDHEKVLSEKAVDEALFDLQMVLLEADVAFPVTEAITNHMKEELVGTHSKLFTSADKVVTEALKHAIEKVLGNGFDLVQYINTHEKPVKIIFTGVNGTGKTTSVAKIANYLKSQGVSVVCGAADTFRAGAIDQLRVHCDRLDVKLIAHQEGSDPSSVLFDTVEYAKAHNIDVVLGDTAGRFHNKTNLMNQLDKIKRVIKPDLVFYVDEAVAGNDAVIRAEEFEKTTSTNGVILTKVDMDPKGGAAISIAYTIGKPLVFLGVGQEYNDMVPFTPELIINEIFGDGE
ncbi:MAG TPA: signal recognition particle-docking protein FtsY [Methanocorpusculum sp.]|nr:signal recognition particle-docking protein FtsY [Methanocorpusculum sp.]HJJ40070.1 signal recognition particle-docking protein FtsY [Methanocorpusculum sp.]HJJ49553.1 signal recognition particle-docking protein FtsY [Methanocorpusculum sp.]HJJ57105.1 signal recognition particle-docking protein FtsY [Methanocorpusculum sp.]